MIRAQNNIATTTKIIRVQLVEQELSKISEHLSSPLVLSGVCVARSLVLCVVFVDCCLPLFFWPLCCLSFFDLRILVTPLVMVSSNSSYFLFIYSYKVLFIQKLIKDKRNTQKYTEDKALSFTLYSICKIKNNKTNRLIVQLYLVVIDTDCIDYCTIIANTTRYIVDNSQGYY